MSGQKLSFESTDDEIYFSNKSETCEDKVQAYEELNQNDILKSIDSEIEKFRSQARDVSKARVMFLIQKHERDIDLYLKALKAHSKEPVVEKTVVQDGNHLMKADSSAIKCEKCLLLVPIKGTKQLVCGHLFCMECLKYSIIENFKSRYTTISCSGENCEYFL